MMRYLRLSIPRDVFGTFAPEIGGEVLNVQLLDDGTLLELALVHLPPDELRAMVETNTGTNHFSHEIVPTGDEECYIYQHCRPTEQVQKLLGILNAHRLMIVFPISIDGNAGVSIEIIGRQADIQSGFDALPEEIRRRASIERVDEYSPTKPGVVSVLTDRQRDVLRAAATVGYYDVPRRGTAADVAAVVGCAPSTASEHLRKIEARILTALAENPHGTN